MYVNGGRAHAQYEKYVKGGVWGGGEMFTPSVLFSFFGSLNGHPAYPVRIGWALSTPKKCFGGKLIPRGEIPKKKSNVPILGGKNPLFNAKKSVGRKCLYEEFKYGVKVYPRPTGHVT